jgi:hypothetical protein
MDGTRAGRYHERSPGIFLQQPWEYGGCGVVDWIGRKPWHGQPFVHKRQHLPQERIARVARTHAGDVALRSKEGKEPGRTNGPRLEFRRQSQHTAKLKRIAHGMLEDLLPGRGSRNCGRDRIVGES